MSVQKAPSEEPRFRGELGLGCAELALCFLVVPSQPGHFSSSPRDSSFSLSLLFVGRLLTFQQLLTNTPAGRRTPGSHIGHLP